jgi:hypothetical protein
MRGKNPLYKGFKWYGQFNSSDNSLQSKSFNSAENDRKSKKNYESFLNDLRKKRGEKKNAE